jgi:hypothetical protein
VAAEGANDADEMMAVVEGAVADGVVDDGVPRIPVVARNDGMDKTGLHEIDAESVARTAHGEVGDVGDACHVYAAACTAVVNIPRTPSVLGDSVLGGGGAVVHGTARADRGKPALEAIGMYIVVVAAAAKADKESGRVEKGWLISEKKTREN